MIWWGESSPFAPPALNSEHFLRIDAIPLVFILGDAPMTYYSRPTWTPRPSVPAPARPGDHR